jgi:hypothetical protein
MTHQVRAIDAEDLMANQVLGFAEPAWMPEGMTLTNSPYLGETPWAAAACEYPVQWEPIRMRPSDPDQFEVYPAWLTYHWEGGGYDCSLEESVSATSPAPLLFERGKLTWRPNTRSWNTAKNGVVAEHHEGAGHNALLVRESWLKSTLADGGWGLIVGWLGEKQLVGGGLRGSFKMTVGVASRGLSRRV